MRIILVGDGKVGHTLAAQLTQEGHDVIVVDRSEAVLQKAQDELDVLTISGNGANAAALMNAGVDRADIVIATTATDEVNMLCSLISKRLGAKYTIARIRDPEYNEALNMLQRDLGIDQAVNPERATAQEISRLLRYPFASNIETFARGRVEMVAFRALPTDGLVGHPLKDLNRRIHDLPRVLYAAVEQDGIVHIPNGDFVIRAGDKVHVAQDVSTITTYFRYLKRNTSSIRNVLILGGGRIGFYLARMIAPLGIRVSIIEIDPERCTYLADQLPDVDIICGDGTDQELLEQEGIADYDAFVSLGSRDEENLMTGLYAIRRGVKKVIAKNNRVSYLELIDGLGLESIVSPREITSDAILRYVRGRVNGQGTSVEKLYKLVNGQAEALEFTAKAGDPYLGRRLMDLKLIEGAIIAVNKWDAIDKNDKTIYRYTEDVKRTLSFMPYARLLFISARIYSVPFFCPRSTTLA